MSLRQQVEQAVRGRRSDELERIVSQDPGALRHLLSLMYDLDEEIRRFAAAGIALGARFHRRTVEQIIKRLVWAMNEESGTNAAHAPEVLRAIAGERPELLVPVVPDLVRLSGDITLYDELVAVLNEVADKCPGKVGRGITDALNQPERRQ
jgi:hypothetical protein